MVDSLTAVLNSFPPGTTLDIAVVPVTDQGITAAPDDFITVTTPDPDGIVGAPDDPTLATDATGNLSITWDGLMAGITPAPEFAYVRPEISANGTSGWSPAGSQLSQAGSTVIANVGAGTWYIHLVPVDTLGRDGTPSAAVSQVVDPTLGDTRTPKAPTSLAVTSTGIWSGSQPSANVTATWTAVTEATDNSSMTIASYELWGKLHAATDYSLLTSTVGTDTTLTYNDISPLGSSWDFELRAIGSNVVPSAFSTAVTTTIATPALLLDPPTAPDLTSVRGLVIVSWDGNLIGSGAAYAAPAYLSNVDIWASVDGGTNYTRVGFMQAGTRTESIAGLGVGTDVTVLLVAVDVLGQQTAGSATDDVVVTGIDGADILANSISGNDIQAGSIEVDRVSPSFGTDLNLSANNAINIVAGAAAAAQATANSNATNLAAMQTVYSFTPSGAIISAPGSAFAVSISNTEMDFLQAGTKRAWLTAAGFFAPKMTTKEIDFTYHTIGDDAGGAGTVIKRF